MRRRPPAAGAPARTPFLENRHVNSAFASTRLLPLALALSLAGCSSFENLMSGDKVDYRGQSQKSAALEVPPDLSQLAREGRYQQPGGVVSASTLRQQTTGPVAAATGPAVAPNAVGDMRIERVGNVRYLVTTLPADKLYPLLRNFWQERGFTLAVDNPEIGLMETDWAENRAKIPQDALRRTLGRVIEGLYSTPERDRFRTRIERSATGSEVYISHRGMVEIFTSELKDATVWQQRPTDPELEAEFLSRLMVKLGAKEETARSTVAAAPVATTPVRARSTALPATAAMDVPDNFDRTWRQVGLALDRSGFTIEDRDRSAGLYFVRYIDPKLAGKEEPGFFSKLFGGGKDNVRPQRVRVLVKSQGAASTSVAVQTADGAPDNSEQARTIIGKLIDELRP
ncbi:MAG TPA: outer membrane protein assembly factor BamC [Aquabacterium sp.]|nr:outer membrane protein assembly factor BamC [Aquabacterium sp.]HQC96965.1 outer membrane protein assembly factor BamC [Aquabacterium sp.]